MREECCGNCGWFVGTYRSQGLCDLTEDVTDCKDWCGHFIEAEITEALEERERFC